MPVEALSLTTCCTLREWGRGDAAGRPRIHQGVLTRVGVAARHEGLSLILRLGNYTTS